MAKKTERQGFVLYHSLRKPLEMLDDAQRGKLFLAILDYSEHGLLPDFNDAVIDMAFAFIRDKLDRDADAYKDMCEKRAIAGSKGGKQRVANQANASKSSQPEPEPKPEPEPEPKPKPDPEPERNKKKRERFVPPTLDEVRAYCRQRNSPVDPVQFYDYFTADPSRAWIDAKGQPVQNWKQKIVTWEKFNVTPRKSKPVDDGRATNNIFLQLLDEMEAQQNGQK